MTNIASECRSANIVRDHVTILPDDATPKHRIIDSADRLVNMSQRSPRGDAKSEAARQHWLSERVFDWSGVPVAHSGPTILSRQLIAQGYGVQSMSPEYVREAHTNDERDAEAIAEAAAPPTMRY